MSAVLVFLINVLPLLLSSILMMPAPTPNPFPVGNTLIVTAHPDDEVMFFSTAVQALTREKHGEVWALCLSNGSSPLCSFVVGGRAFSRARFRLTPRCSTRPFP